MPFSISRALLAPALFLIVLAGSSCHKKQVPVAVPVQPDPAPAVETRPQTRPAPPVTASPQSTAPPMQTTPAKDESKYQQNKAAEPQPPPKRVTRPATNPLPAVAPAPATPPATTAQPPAAEPPRLGDILTPEQERQYHAAIDQSVAHALSSLGTLANRQLTKEQEATVAQVRNFITQAQETSKKDLAAAKSLAERAEVLAHDLVENLK